MNGTVHPAAGGFGGAAAAYDRGRPTYPAAALELVTGLVRGSPGGPLVDLAAGTGIFTAGLVHVGLRPIAAEPVPGMRDRLVAALPSVPVVAATAEALPFADGSVGAVTVAQAFHWFDGPRAVHELARVQMPSAPLAIAFNVRVPDDPIQAALEEIWEPYRRDTPTHRFGAWQRAFEHPGPFSPLEHRAVPHVQVVDAEALVDRVVSVSFIALLPEDERARVASRTRAVLDGAATASLPYRTDVWWALRT